MSQLKVNGIVNFANDGPIELSSGLTIPLGQRIDGSLNANVGFCTATEFHGDGSALTGILGIPRSIAIGLPFVTGSV
jgi:hypothetical protein